MKFQNSSFVVEAEEEQGCRLSLKVEVLTEEAKKAYKQAVKKVNKEISVPGFRKGKAPDATVIKNYNSYVEREWRDILLNEALQAAFTLTKVYPLNKNSVEKPHIEKCSLEEGALIRFAYEHYPQVPPIDFTRIQLPPEQKESVSEERVEDIIREIRRAHADWEDVEGRAVQEGDYVDVTIEAIDEEPPKTIVKDRRFEVAEKHLARWLRTLLLDQEVGSVIEGVSEIDEKADESVKAKFKPTQVRITLHAIKKILLPTLTDELAQKAGASSVEDLMTKIQANLEREAEDIQRQKQYHALEQALLEHYHFDIPSSIATSEQEVRLKNKIQELRNQQLSEQEIKDREPELETEVVRETEEAIRLYFLSKQIVQQGNITVSNQELNEEIVRHIQRNPMYYEKEMDQQTSRELVSRLTSALMQRKAKEYALSQVVAHM